MWHTVMPDSGITNQRRWKKSTGSHTVRSSLHTTLPWEPIHKLMDSLHTFIFDQALYVRKSLSCPHKWRSTKLLLIIFKDHWTKLMRRYGDKTYTVQTDQLMVLLLWFMCCFGETFWGLLCSLDCLIPICIWNAFRYHQLMALINVVSSRESSRLFSQRIVPYLTHFQTQSSWLTLPTKSQYKLKLICYRWCCLEQIDLPRETKSFLRSNET